MTFQPGDEDEVGEVETVVMVGAVFASWDILVDHSCWSCTAKGSEVQTSSWIVLLIPGKADNHRRK